MPTPAPTKALHRLARPARAVRQACEWRPCAAALVPSRAVHTIDVSACNLSVVLFIEPETPEGKAVCMQLVLAVSGTTLREPTSDLRVLAAVEYIRQRVDQTVSLPEVAKAANLSPGRFRHLFVEQTGMPLRTYVLWRRLLHVWTLLRHGETLSSAAHAAGFADSAHLSRTSRTMFGLPPSVLQMKGPLSVCAREPQQHHFS